MTGAPAGGLVCGRQGRDSPAAAVGERPPTRPGRRSGTRGRTRTEKAPLKDLERADGVGQGAAETAVAARVQFARVPEVATVEIGPQGVEEDHFRVRRLPEQEVRRALLAGRPEEQVD